MFSAALHISRTLLRVPKFLPVAVLVAACALLGASQARPTILDTTSTTLNMSSTSIGLGDTVTLTATVTGTSAPTGSVTFTAQQSGGSLLSLGPAALSAVSGTQSRATFQASGFAAGTYTVVANYRSDNSVSFGNSVSGGQLLTVVAVLLHTTTMSLSVNPSTLNDGDPANLVATVAENDGGGIIPTGVVTFHAEGSGSDTLLG
jgi:acyl-CoA hydrolase